MNFYIGQKIQRMSKCVENCTGFNVRRGYRLFPVKSDNPGFDHNCHLSKRIGPNCENKCIGILCPKMKCAFSSYGFYAEDARYIRCPKCDEIQWLEVQKTEEFKFPGSVDLSDLDHIPDFSREVCMVKDNKINECLFKKPSVSARDRIARARRSQRPIISAIARIAGRTNARFRMFRCRKVILPMRFRGSIM